MITVGRERVQRAWTPRGDCVSAKFKNLASAEGEHPPVGAGPSFLPGSSFDRGTLLQVLWPLSSCTQALQRLLGLSTSDLRLLD